MATVVPTALELPEELHVIGVEELPEQVTLWQDAWRRLQRNRMAVIGLVIIAVFFVTALLSLVWTPYPTWRQALGPTYQGPRSEEHTSELQSHVNLVCRLLLEKKKIL